MYYQDNVAFSSEMRLLVIDLQTWQTTPRDSNMETGFFTRQSEN